MRTDTPFRPEGKHRLHNLGNGGVAGASVVGPFRHSGSDKVGV